MSLFNLARQVSAALNQCVNHGGFSHAAKGMKTRRKF